LRAAQARIRSLEEDVAARDKTIGEQRERVVKLEKTIKDMQALIDLKSKGMAEAQKQASAPPAAPGGKEPAAPPAIPEPPKPELAMGPSSGVGAPTEPAAPGMAGAQSGVAAPAKPKRPKVVVVQPPPEPSLIDTILGEPMYLAAGGGAIVLIGGLAYMLMRRRRSGGDYDDEAEKKTSELASPDEPTDDMPAAPSLAGAAPRPAAAAQVTEEVDPLAEAEIYLAYGRDGQAEDILKEALANNPRRQEVQVKLLEIYAKRKDVGAFDTIARDLQVTTGGQGEVWAQAAMLGYSIDPSNPRYSAGKAAGAAAAGAAAGGLEDKLLDFNIGMEEADVGTKTDIDLSRLAAGAPSTTTDIDLTNLGGVSGSTTGIDVTAGPETTLQPGMIDLDLGPGGEPETVDTAAPSGIDFDFDLSSLSAEAPAAGTQTVTRAMQQTVADVGTPDGGTLEFDLSQISLDEPGAGRQEPTMELSSASPVLPEIDLSNISLDLGGGGESAAGGSEAPKDDRWYDVQTKFDLAKAYQEMGDKEGAREILHEVIAEGDAEQKSAAQKVLETLG
jgi:pilus assembly protein FimV